MIQWVIMKKRVEDTYRKRDSRELTIALQRICTYRLVGKKAKAVGIDSWFLKDTAENGLKKFVPYK